MEDGSLADGWLKNFGVNATKWMLNLYAELFLLVVVVVPSGQRLDEDAE
ncbi:hypothetical protein [Streptococcus pneumoniae]|nr:hypothetical protein [Streptococcus pneumoniae]